MRSPLELGDGRGTVAVDARYLQPLADQREFDADADDLVFQRRPCGGHPARGEVKRILVEGVGRAAGQLQGNDAGGQAELIAEGDDLADLLTSMSEAGDLLPLEFVEAGAEGGQVGLGHTVEIPQQEGFLVRRGPQLLQPVLEQAGQIDPLAVGVVLDDDAEDLVVKITRLGGGELADDGLQGLVVEAALLAEVAQAPAVAFAQLGVIAVLAEKLVVDAAGLEILALLLEVLGLLANRLAASRAQRQQQDHPQRG